MAHDYIPEAERRRLEEDRKSKNEFDRLIAQNNSGLVGNPREYKGITYQMRRNGLYVCLNTQLDTKLKGSFTSPRIIRKLVDDMEKSGEIKL